MGSKLSEKEMEIIKDFKITKYPSIYKTDRTDNILFLELVDFDVCTYLLNGSKIKPKKYNYIMNEYQKFLAQVDINSFDEYAQVHYNKVVTIMEMFKKYYN